jgi:uncharacterized membrane protein YbhN (UPF0104 family)
MNNQAKKLPASRIWNILKIVLALGLVAYVLSRTELGQVMGLRHQIHWGWLTVVFILYAVLTLLKALQYSYLIGRRSEYLQVLNIVVIQNAVTNFIANSAGVASYLTLFRVEQGVKISSAGIVFLLTKIWDLLAVWVFLLVASLLLWRQIPGLHALIAVLLIVIGAVILAFFLTVFLRQKFVAALGLFLDWSRLGRVKLVVRAMEILRSLAGQERGFTPPLVGTGILYSLIRMVITMAWLYANMQTFSFQVELLQIVFVNLLMQLISYLPIHVFGGLGVTETTALYFFGFFDIPHAELAAVLIGHRLVFYLTNLAMLLYLPLHIFLASRKPADGITKGAKSLNEKADEKAR